MKKAFILAAVAAAFAMVSCEKEPTLDVVANFTSEEVSYEGIALTANVTSENGKWTATSDADWVTIDPATGEGAATVRFVVAPNATKQSRKATVTITLASLVKTVEINQAAHPKDAIDDLAFTGGNKISYSINKAGKYYTGVVSKSDLSGFAEMVNGGDVNLSIVQMCSGLMAGNVKTVDAPAEASFEGKTVAWYFNMFGGSDIKAGEIYTIFAIPVAVADENDKAKFDQIIFADFKAE